MKPGKVTTPVILGQPWQRTYNSVPNWRREGITYEKEGTRFFVPFIEEACYTSDDNSDTQSHASEPAPQEDNQEECAQKPIQAPALLNKTSQQAKRQPKPQQPVNTASNQIWVPKQLKQAQEGYAQIWIPKRTTQHKAAKKQQMTKPQRIPPIKNNTQQKAKATPRSTRRKELAESNQTHQRWIPTALLQAQGYYEGATQIWLPRAKNVVPNQRNKTAPVTPTQTTYKWVPKQKTTQQKATKAATTYKWVPKQGSPSPSPPSKTPLPINKLTPKKATAQEKGKWIPKQRITQQEVPIHTTMPSTSQETSIKHQEGQASRAKVTDKARQLAYLLMTLNQETLVKLWLQQRATKATTENAASTTQATGPHMLQYPPLAQH